MSRFVSAGTDANPIQHDEAWVIAQQQVEAQRKPKQPLEKQDDGKSLYEVLQANKAAKQDAYEESIRLKNQFRALQDDEIEFLDAVNETARAKESAAKQEIAEQLEAFRKQRQAAEESGLDTPADSTTRTQPTDASEAWTTKKRKKKEKDGPVLKLRKLSESSDVSKPQSAPSAIIEKPVTEKAKQEFPITRPRNAEDSEGKQAAEIAKSVTPPVKDNLGLAAYSSDEE